MQIGDSPPVPSSDRFALDRFVRAQDPVWDEVIRELRAAAKRTHWMWFVFPQIAGLGRSETARRFAVGSMEEARAYLAHPVLGPRLREVVRLLLASEGRSAHAIFGSPDDRKLRSSLTLFGQATREDVFDQALARFFGTPDPETLRLLADRNAP